MGRGRRHGRAGGQVRRQVPGEGAAGGGDGPVLGWVPLVAICLAVFMLLMDVTVVTVALPQMRADLSASLPDLQWVISAYALTLAACQLTAGSLGDRFGRRRLFIAGIGLFAVASAGCAAAPGAGLLIGLRAVQGVGGAVMFTTSLALVADCYQGRRRAIAFGVRGAVSGFAVAVGPLAGGLLTTGLSWRWIFVLNLPLAALAVALTLVTVPGRAGAEAEGRPVDWAGFASFTGALVLLVYALLNASADGWGSARILGPLAGAAALLGVFAWLEHRVPSPMLDLGRFRDRAFTGAQLAGLAEQGSLFPLFVFIPLYFESVLGFSALATGVRSLVLTVPVLLVGPAAGRLTTRIRPAALVAAGLGAMAAGIFMMHGLTATSRWTALVPGFIVAGIAVGVSFPPLNSLALDVVEPAQAGAGAGINNTFQQVGFSAGVAVYGTLFTAAITARLSTSLPPALAAGEPVASLAKAIAGGQIATVAAGQPAPARGLVSQIAVGAFTVGLNELFLAAGAVALLGAIAALLCLTDRKRTPASGHPDRDRDRR